VARVSRRDFLGTGALAAGALAFGPGFWRTAMAAPATAGPGPYGPPGPPDPTTGIGVPNGFSVREIARANRPVAGSAYPWHIFPDGQATFPTADGGWIFVSNSETLDGGASAIRFASDGRVEDAYRILSGTGQNCSGCGTPWGTWLSCEEVEDGLVWECDPAGGRAARPHPAMGVFKHESAAVDPRGRRVYLTEDLIDGCFYRFTPASWPSLRAGTLEVASVARGGRVDWTAVPDPAAGSRPTRDQARGSTRFARAEGIWFDSGTVSLATTADSRVHAYDTIGGRIEVVYDGLASRAAPLVRIDQLTGSPAGELFVCEDIATDSINMGVIASSGGVSRFLAVTGPEHRDSELTGAAFDPSGRRLYFASQRARRTGAIYEVTGPFRRRREAVG
jgi:secreted PhoX family phosphatase